MNRTVEQQCPFEWLEQEPEERKYWRCNLRFLPGREVTWNGVQSAFTSERAAWMVREAFLPSGNYYAEGPVYESTRQELIDFALSIGAHTVRIFDDIMTVVEDWPL